MYWGRLCRAGGRYTWWHRQPGCDSEHRWGCQLQTFFLRVLGARKPSRPLRPDNEVPGRRAQPRRALDQAALLRGERRLQQQVPPPWPAGSPGSPYGAILLHGEPPPSSGRTDTAVGLGRGQMMPTLPRAKAHTWAWTGKDISARDTEPQEGGLQAQGPPPCPGLPFPTTGLHSHLQRVNPLEN